MNKVRVFAVSTALVLTAIFATFGYGRVAEASVSQIWFAMFGASNSAVPPQLPEDRETSQKDDRPNLESQSNFGSAPCVAGEKTWDGEGATNNWSEAANWSCDAVPLLSDIVIFDATSTKDATIDINTSADQFRMNAGYTGTISTAPGGTFSFGRSIASIFTSNQASGNFVCGSGSTVTFAKMTFTQTGGNFDCRAGSLLLDVGTININGGTFDAPTGSTILEGISNGVGSQISLGSGGTFNHNTGTVFVKNAASINSAGQPLVLNNLEAWAQTSLNLDGSVARVMGDLNIVDDNITKDGKISGATNSVWELHGNMSVSANVALNTNNFITFAGSGDQTFINSGGVNPSAKWRMNKPSGQLILLSDLSNFGSLHLDNGIINAGNFTVNVVQGEVNGGNANSYVIGKFRRQFRAFGAVELFPVGTANGYSPATANSSTSGGTLTVEAKHSVHPAMNPATSLARYWTVSQTGNAAATMTFTYLDGDINGNENLYAGARINNGTAFLAPVNTATNVITVSGETLFGDFTASESLAPCVAGQKTWDGEGATNNWSEAANWSCNAVPATTDHVIFDATSSEDATIDVEATVLTLTIATGYSGTVDHGPANFRVTGNFAQSAGTFNGGSGRLDFDTNFALTGGTFRASSGETTFGPSTANAFTLTLETAAAFDPNGGTSVLKGALNLAGGATSMTFHNLDVRANNNIGSGKTVVANNDLTLTNGQMLGGTIDALGGVNILPTFDGGNDNTATLRISGAATRTITLPGTPVGGGIIPRLRIDAPNATVTATSPVTFHNSVEVASVASFGNGETTFLFNKIYTQTGGTFAGGAGDLDFAVGMVVNSGTFRLSSGTTNIGPTNGAAVVVTVDDGVNFDANGGTAIWRGAYNFLGTAPSLTYNNLTILSNFAFSVVPSTTTPRSVTVAGTLNFNNGEMLSGVLNATGPVNFLNTIDGGAGTLRISGNLARTVVLPAGLILPVTEIDAPNAEIVGDGTSGTIVFDRAFNIFNAASVSNGAMFYDFGVFRQDGGTFNAGGGTIRSRLSFTQNGGSFLGSSGNLEFRGTTTVSGTFRLSSHNSTFGGPAGPALTVNPSATFDPNGGTFVADVGTNYAGVFTLTLDNLRIQGNTPLPSNVTWVARGTTELVSGFYQGTIRAEGDVIVGAAFPSSPSSGILRFTGGADQTYTNNGGLNPTGIWTIGKTAGRVIAASSIALGATTQLFITNGTLYLNAGSNLLVGTPNATTVPALVIGPGGRLVSELSTTASPTSISTFGNIVNDGVVDLRGGAGTCPGDDSVSISGIGQRQWNGSGTNRFVNVTVSSMTSAAGQPVKTVYSGGNGGNVNTSFWNFDPNCPADVSLSPSVAGVQTGQTQTFTAGGGFAPYTFSIPTNNSGGSINGAGVYTAGPTFGVTDTIRVTDAFGGTADATVNVVGVATKLGFTVQPQNTTAGATLPTVTVAVQDALGNTVPNAPKFVQLALVASNGAVLAGTTTGTTVNGIVNFNNLSIAAAGTYTLTALTSGLTNATSGSFSITPGAPSALAFRVQPANAGVGAAITPAIAVAIVDSLGNVVTSATHAVTLSLANNPTGATLAGTTTVTAVNGIATFADLSLDRAGTGFTLAATASGLSSATSSPFDVTSPFVVTNTNGGGPGSLVQVITDANAAPGRETIQFNIPGTAPFIIETTQPLPAANNVVIDATTQPGYAGTPIVEFRQDEPFPNVPGLSISDSVVRGLAIVGFTDGVKVVGGTHSEIRDCYIGTVGNGTLPIRNINGITAESGAVVVEDNLISGNSRNGIFIKSVIPGGAAQTHVIRRNRIGTTATGVDPLPNNTGIRFQSAAAVGGSIAPTVVGGNDAEGNIIAFNAATGIFNLNFRNVNIRGNSIHSNGFLGIDNKVSAQNSVSPEVSPNDPLDVDEGPNRVQNFPVLSKATSAGIVVTVGGTLNSRPSQTYALDFYSNPVCNTRNVGQGRNHIGSTQISTDASGIAAFNSSFAGTAAIGSIVTATATDADGNTSEFSACRVVSEAVFSISGRVIDNFGNPVAGLTVKTSTNKKAATNLNGEYSFGNLPGGTSLSVNPVIQGTSSPTSATFSNLAADQTNVDFTVTPNVKLSGAVTTNLGGALGGVVITATGPVSQTRRTDINGRYLFSQLPAGTYQLTAAKDGFSIAPNPTTVVLDANRVANFTAGLNGFADGRFFIGANGVDSRSSDLSSFAAIFRQSGLSCSASAPAVSSDGVALFAACRKLTGSGAPVDQLWSMRADGSQLTNLSASFDTSGSINDLSFDAASGYLTYSSAIQGSTYLHLMQSNDNAIAAFTVPYTRGALPAIESPSIDPANPSETRIAFVLYNHNSNGQYQIFRYDVDTQTLIQLTSDPTRKLRSKYSPNGTKILFIKEVANGAGTLWTMNADGTGEQQIGTDSNVDFATWSPAGTKIAFTTPTETVMIDPTGANRQSLGERIGRFSWGRSPNFDTPAGTNVQHGFCDFQITFANVALEGTTSINTVLSSSLPTSSSFRIGNVAFEVTTTAVVSPPINVCFRTSPNISLAAFNRLSMLHGENGVMVDRTTSRDFANKLICGTVTSLSPFALGEVIDAGLPSITGDANLTTTTDANGNYSFPNLPADGLYQVTPFVQATVLSPATQIVAPLTANAAGVDFAAFVPTAADGFVAGRVLTANGAGIRNAAVTITDASTGESRTARTGTFGLYRFDALETGRTYVVTVSAKRYRFSADSRVISLSDSVGDADFVAFLRE